MQLIPTLILAVGLLTAIYFIARTIKNVQTPKKSEPHTEEQATVVAKRQSYTGAEKDGAVNSVFRGHMLPLFFVTFKLENGDTVELAAEPEVFGTIAEGDTGVLSRQGQKMISFER